MEEASPKNSPDSSSQESNSVSTKIISLQTQAEQMLHNATLMTEIALDIKDKCHSCEKHVSCLRNFAMRTCKTINTIQNSGKSFLLLAQKLILSAQKLLEEIPVVDPIYVNLKYEYERLLIILEKELSDIDDLESVENNLNQNLADVSLKSISEKIKFFEERQKLNDSNLFSTNSTKSFKSSDVDEKYPERFFRDLPDLDNVINLPPVPEDIFATFATCNKPRRTCSLSSLKHLRKLKLCLHRAECVSDEDESESEEQNLSKCGIGDVEEKDPPARSPSPTKASSPLGDIEEEN